ncbi:MAG TPA: hypothetical protein VEJ63_01075, partial [Planctomycetota bacterium]|nr:hypothetical protein [Planctomycetota bacterium]
MRVFAALLAVFAIAACSARASTVDDLKKEVEDLRKRINERTKASPIGSVDTKMGAKYGPNAPVTTKTG